MVLRFFIFPVKNSDLELESVVLGERFGMWRMCTLFINQTPLDSGAVAMRLSERTTAIGEMSVRCHSKLTLQAPALKGEPSTPWHSISLSYFLLANYCEFSMVSNLKFRLKCSLASMQPLDFLR